MNIGLWHMVSTADGSRGLMLGRGGKERGIEGSRGLGVA